MAEERMFFIGVSTESSSIMKLFPIWSEVLGLDATIEGRDLPIDGDPVVYRDAVREIAENDDVKGALVTTHKVAVFRHAGELFTRLDANARLCREVSCISKQSGRLVGHAKDPIASGRSMERIFAVPPSHVLCLGAGGAGTAIGVYLLRHPRPPERVVVVDRDPQRIDEVRGVLGQLDGDGAVSYRITAGAEENDALLAEMPEGSFVVNATGMGKDTPGSPVSSSAVFPRGAIVWELNYRGELDFLRQAESLALQRGLQTHDGWNYFVYGWSEVLAEVFRFDLTEDLFEELRSVAEPLRPRRR
jgi:shikimate dehydrogenase